MSNMVPMPQDIFLTSLPRLKSWDSRPLMLRPVGFALHRIPYVGMSLHAL